MRKHETCTRGEFLNRIADLDGDTQLQLMADLARWYDDGLELVRYTVDSLGRIDSESDPYPCDG